MMGICSLFGLSRGLSLLAEVVRMLGELGKKGKPTKGVVRLLRRLGLPSSLLPYITGKATAAVLGSWVVTSGANFSGRNGWV
jgi:hypothetical protein